MAQPVDDSPNIAAIWKIEFVEEAVRRLYQRDQHLVNEGLERAASSRIACHLSRILEETSFFERFPEVRVDIEYGREGDGPKRSVAGRPVVPDIIVHRPGPAGPNVVVIEVKAWWNDADRDIDEVKLRGYLQRQNYSYAYFIELGRTGPAIRTISIEDPASIPSTNEAQFF